MLVKFKKFSTLTIIRSMFLVFAVFAVFFYFSNFTLAQQDDYIDSAQDLILPGVGVTVGVVEMVVRIINYLLGFLGLLGIILLIYAGFVWMTAAGDSKKADKAKKIIINAIIGLVIILLSFLIVKIVINFVHNWAEGQIDSGSGGGNGGGNGGGGLPQNIFQVSSIVTSCGGPPQYNIDVYLCSAVVINFNHHIGENSVKAAIENKGLKIDECPDANCSNVSVPSFYPANYSGATPTGDDSEWTVNGRSVTFLHDKLFNSNQYYRLVIPKTLTDKTGLAIDPENGCANCSNSGAFYYWIFQTGETLDKTLPELFATYPKNQTNSGYPDRKVNLSPLIWLKFSEGLLPSSVNKQNIRIREITGQVAVDGTGGNLGSYISENNYEVGIDADGQKIEIYFENGFILNPFRWYQIEISGIQDLCNNLMSGQKVWRFQTDDTVPGVASVYPSDGYQNSCPDTSVFIIFNTSMYNPENGSCQVTQDGNGGGYVTEGSGIANRFLQVSDNYPGGELDPNDYCKIYEFVPESVLLAVNQNYNPQVRTNLVIDQQGNTLNYGWNFKTTVPENCANAPVITRISPNHGPDGACITIFGRHFDSTYDGIGNSDKATFAGQVLNIDSIAWSDRQIATTIPNPTDLEKKDTKYPIQITISHPNPIGALLSNEYQFLLDDAPAAEGPCLWNLSPDKGRPARSVVASGDRFGITQGSLIFSNNVNAMINSWDGTKNQIKTSVPIGAVDGDVMVQDSLGRISNPLYFDVIGVGDDPGKCSSEKLICVPDNTLCAESYECNQNCKCQRINDNGNGDGDKYLRIINDSRCEIENSSITVYPSPNPYKNKQDICRNVLISARFNKKLNEESVNNQNIKVFKCIKNEADEALINSVLAITESEKDKYGNCNEEITGNIEVINISENQDSFRFSPNSLLDRNIYYYVWLSRNLTAVDGAQMEKDKDWYFKTQDSSQPCAFRYIDVLPSSYFTKQTGKKINYRAIGFTDYCQEISTNASFDWTSSDVNIARVAVNDPSNTSYATATVTAFQEAGQANIMASSLGKSDFGILKYSPDENINKLCNSDELMPGCQIDNAICGENLICNPTTCRCDSPYVQPTADVDIIISGPNGEQTCTNLSAQALFDQLMNSASLSSNIKVWEKRNLQKESESCVGRRPVVSSDINKSENDGFKLVINKIKGFRTYAFTQKIVPYCHSRESGNPEFNIQCVSTWIPAFAGMTGVTNAKILELFGLIKNVFAQTNFTSGDYWCEINSKISNIQIPNEQQGCNNVNGCGLAIITPTQNLKKNNQYQVTINSGMNGVKSAAGTIMASDSQWNFSVSQNGQFCKIDKVNIIPLSFTFTKLNQSQNFTAIAYSSDNNILDSSNSSYPFSWQWTESDIQDIIAISQITNTGTGAVIPDRQLVTANNKNGRATIFATASSTLATLSQNMWSKRTGSASITNFLCLNPVMIEDRRDASNYKTMYCRDRGDETTQTDDLPKVNEHNENGDSDKLLLVEKFLIVASSSDDAIGIRVYENKNKLTSKEWYLQNAPNPGQNVSSLVVDGYDAVRVGRTVYVAAVNHVGNPPRLNDPIYYNLYLISYNEGASADTVNIFNQLISNWQFNDNILDFAKRDALHRDVKRLYDLGDIKSYLSDYYIKNDFYPKLEAGSYEVGRSTSRWPSWQDTLSKDLGKTVPVDPINKFARHCSNEPGQNCWENSDCENNGLCMDSCPAGYDVVSCWNENTKHFECPAGSHIYQYQTEDSGTSFKIYANMEYEDVNWGMGVNDVVDQQNNNSCRDLEMSN